MAVNYSSRNGFPKEKARHACYLVARTNKIMYEIGEAEIDSPEYVMRLLRLLDECALSDTQATHLAVISFAVKVRTDIYSYGYASHHWAIDLFQHLHLLPPKVLGEHIHEIRGLLFGYTADAIEAFNKMSIAFFNRKGVADGKEKDLP